MPNQLAETKKRKTIAEHASVLAALEHLAKEDATTSTELLRTALRNLIRERATAPNVADQLRTVVSAYAPAPTHFKTPAKAARFKRQQREHDALLSELNLASPEELQNKNSVHNRASKPKLASSL